MCERNLQSESIDVGEIFEGRKVNLVHDINVSRTFVIECRGGTIVPDMRPWRTIRSRGVSAVITEPDPEPDLEVAGPAYKSEKHGVKLLF